MEQGVQFDRPLFKLIDGFQNVRTFPFNVGRWPLIEKLLSAAHSSVRMPVDQLITHFNESFESISLGLQCFENVRPSFGMIVDNLHEPVCNDSGRVRSVGGVAIFLEVPRSEMLNRIND